MKHKHSYQIDDQSCRPHDQHQHGIVDAFWLNHAFDGFDEDREAQGDQEDGVDERP